jgi:tRNA C32,U32 (ribose-2'-O)-methylase TrmJ
LFGTSDNQKSIGKLTSQTYDKAKYNMPVALLLGAEGDGLGKLVGERCDVLVTLPMRGKVNSLNVATAAAVLTYEIKRQHEACAPVAVAQAPVSQQEEASLPIEETQTENLNHES